MNESRVVIDRLAASITQATTDSCETGNVWEAERSKEPMVWTADATAVYIERRRGAGVFREVEGSVWTQSPVS